MTKSNVLSDSSVLAGYADSQVKDSILQRREQRDLYHQLSRIEKKQQQRSEPGIFVGRKDQLFTSSEIVQNIPEDVS